MDLEQAQSRLRLFRNQNRSAEDIAAVADAFETGGAVVLAQAMRFRSYG